MSFKVGDFVVVGTTINGKFSPSNYNTKIRIEKIFEENSGTRIDLNWGSFGNSFVFAHDKGKTWLPVSEYN